MRSFNLKKVGIKAWVLVGSLILFASIVISSEYIYIGTYSSKLINVNNIEIKRKKYPLRNLKWSGIYPVFGGLIPDPHIYSTSVYEFDIEIKSALNDSKARYQGFDINPWFGKEYSEIILAIEDNDKTYEYIVDFSEGVYGFINTYQKIISFKYHNQLVFITTLDVSKPKFLVIALPLQKGKTVKPFYIETESGKKIIEYLKEGNKYKIFKEELCNSSFIPYIELYEKFEPCPIIGVNLN